MPLHIWTNGTDTVIAESLEDAIACIADRYGYKAPEHYINEYGYEDWTAYEPDARVSVHDEAHGNWGRALNHMLGGSDVYVLPKGATVVIVATAQAWIDHLMGNRATYFFSSTEY